MNILLIGTEAAPFAKTGGLGDVLGALPSELAKKGVNAKVILPMYKSIKEQYFAEMEQIAEFETKVAWRSKYCGLYMMEYKGITHYFIDSEEYFNRDKYYGCYDDGERFAYFCKAALDSIPLLPDFAPDILHCSEWQTALVPIYIKTLYAGSEQYAKLRTIFTIHNIEYQGKFGKEIAEDLFSLTGKGLQIAEYGGCLNLMKGAIVTCDKLTTVSPSYAEEIKYAYYARGLEAIIKENEYKLEGVLNGIDTKLFNPWFDKNLYRRYSAKHREGKAENKACLQKEFGLDENPEIPIIGMVTRLVAHKGLDLIVNIFKELMQEEIQLVLLGSGDEKYECFFADAMQRYPGRIWTNAVFDTKIASRIYAGSDMFLMPSLSEPCGLSQMIAAKYGTIPIVRATGGLKDSIIPYDLTEKTGNGITFGKINAQDMLGAIKRAIAFYWQPDNWQSLMDNAFSSDFSWKKGAERYIEIYGGLLDGDSVLEGRVQNKD